jgi:hypothetical protein
MSLIIFVILITLSILYKIDDSMIGTGQIISTERIIIKSQISGYIDQYFVKNGSDVKTNDPLFIYATESIRNNIIDIEQRITNLISEKEIRLNLINYSVKNYYTRIEKLNSELILAREKHEYQSKYINNLLEIYNIGAIAKNQLDKEILLLQEIDKEIKTIKILIEEEINININNMQMLHSYGFDQELNIVSKIDESIEFYNKKKRELELLYLYPIIKSPFDGVINFYDTYYYNDISNKYFSSGESICDIFSNNDFKVKGKIKDIYLPFINIGDSTTIEVQAYNNKKYGFITGEITNIYTLPIENEEIYNKIEYYVDISIPHLSTTLHNGLNVTIYFKLQKEMSLLQYFIKKTIINKDLIQKQNPLFFLYRKKMK